MVFLGRRLLSFVCSLVVMRGVRVRVAVRCYGYGCVFFLSFRSIGVLEGDLDDGVGGCWNEMVDGQVSRAQNGKKGLVRADGRQLS